MFGFGSFSHLVVIFVLALILIGPKQLPEVARTLGRLFNEFKRSASAITDEFKAQTHMDRWEQQDREAQRRRFEAEQQQEEKKPEDKS